MKNQIGFIYDGVSSPRMARRKIPDLSFVAWVHMKFPYIDLWLIKRTIKKFISSPVKRLGLFLLKVAE